jgi:Na+/melibiose symporter-like transporter
LKKIEQKAIFPWEEIAIYIILFMIFAYVLGKILEEKSSLNIFRQFSKLSKTKEQLTLHDKEENVLVDKDIVINIIIIYVLSFYIYRIYNGYLDYYKQFNIKNVDDTR